MDWKQKIVIDSVRFKDIKFIQVPENVKIEPIYYDRPGVNNYFFVHYDVEQIPDEIDTSKFAIWKIDDLIRKRQFYISDVNIQDLLNNRIYKWQEYALKNCSALSYKRSSCCLSISDQDCFIKLLKLYPNIKKIKFEERDIMVHHFAIETIAKLLNLPVKMEYKILKIGSYIPISRFDYSLD